MPTIPLSTSKSLVAQLDLRIASLYPNEAPAENDAKSFARAYFRLGRQIVDAGHVEDGLACYRKALHLSRNDPDLNFDILFRLERLNRVDEAWQVLTAMESRLAGPPAANGKLYILKARLSYRRGERDTARSMLEAFLRDNPRHSHRYLAHGWLGKLLDEAGEHDAAMRAFDEKNAAMASTPAAIEFTRKHEAELAAIAESRRWYHGKTSFGWKETHTPDSAGQPILLVGFPRSGTTLLDQLLNAHSALTTAEEKPHLTGLADRFFGSADRLAALQCLDDRQIADCRRRYWSNVASSLDRPLGETRLVDKLPLNIMHLDLFVRLFPDVKIIVALRDPRDVVLSNYMQLYQLNPSMAAHLSLERSARYYASVMDLYLLFRRMRPNNIYEIHFERLVRETAAEATKLLQFLGLEWEKGLDGFHEQAKQRRISTPSYDQVTQPIYTNAVARWKNYASHLETIQPVVQPFVAAFGYAQ